MDESASTPTLGELRDFWGRQGLVANAALRNGINLLANGRQVTPEAFATVMGIAIEGARSHIDFARSIGLEVEDGAVVGAVLTLRPTPYRFRVRGNDLYTWCGFDALFLPIMLRQPAQVACTCPVTGTPIRLTVQADGTVSDAIPGTVVVGIVGEQITASCSVVGPDSAICSQMPFFASREAGERWLADHPGVAIVDLDDASRIARAYVAEPGAGDG
jgi:alkylmercury lyase